MAELDSGNINKAVLDLVRRFKTLDHRAATRVLAVTQALVDNADDMGDPRVQRYTFTLHCGADPEQVAVEVETVRKRY